MKAHRKFSRNYLCQAVSSALALGLAISAHAVPGVPPYPAVVPLANLDGPTTGFRLDSANAGERSGNSVTGIGDINGDGFDDVLIGAPEFITPLTTSVDGRSYVVFGRDTTLPNNNFPSIFNLGFVGNLGYESYGFKIVGSGFERSGFSVSRAGDVNDDGIDDLIIGAYNANGGNGTAYVVFGRDTTLPNNNFPSPLNLATDLNNGQGFRIEGAPAGAYLGQTVSAAGDLNGDGIDDLLVGASLTDNSKGRVYVVFGHHVGPSVNFPAVVNVAQMDGTSVVNQSGFNGFRIDGANVGDRFGYAISGAGNINGDNFGDVIVSAINGNSNGVGSGSSYVLFGHALPFGANGTGVVDISSLNGSNGIKFDGAAAKDYSGYSVSGGGDLNGDGVDDIVIGATGVDHDNVVDAGSTYVVFGKPQNQPFVSPINLGALIDTEGFRIEGIITESFGSAVSILNDTNGDGIDDLLISAGSDIGRAYLVFGRKSTLSPFSVSTLNTLNGIRGFRLDGVGFSDNAGRSIAPAGDVNNDGLNDLIIGAPLADPSGFIDSGSSYIVFGNNDRIFASTLEKGE